MIEVWRYPSEGLHWSCRTFWEAVGEGVRREKRGVLGENCWSDFTRICQLGMTDGKFLVNAREHSLSLHLLN